MKFGQGYRRVFHNLRLRELGTDLTEILEPITFIRLSHS